MGECGGENEKNVCQPKLGFAHCPWIIESYPGAKRINRMAILKRDLEEIVDAIKLYRLSTTDRE